MPAILTETLVTYNQLPSITSNTFGTSSLITESATMSKSESTEGATEVPEATEESNIHISDIVGNWGPYQRKIFLIATIIYIANPIQNLSLVLYTPPLDFWCADPPVGRSNLTKNVCAVGGEECRAFTYDLQNYRRTITSELDLVCGKSFYASLGQSLHQVGYAISGVGFGFISDNWGRTFSLKIAMVIEIIAGFIQAFTSSSTLWLINRIFIGATVYGRFLNFYVLIIEWVGTKTRAPCGILHEMGYSVGYVLLPIIFYFLPDYRIIQAGLTSTQVISLFVVILLIPESPRWLLTHNQFEKARKLLVKALRAKKVTFDEEEVNTRISLMQSSLKAQIEKEKTMKVPTVIDVMKSPKLLKTSLILYFIWFTQCFNIYGSLFNLGTLGGSIFLNMLLFGISHAVSNVFCHFCLTRIGRRKLMIIFFLVESIAFFSIVAFSFSNSLVVYRVAAAFVVGFTNNANFALIYLYTGETYPTTMRQSAIGTCSIFARIGSVIAPFTKELTLATHLSVGMSVFGVLAGIASFLCLFLGETRGKEIPETVGQAISNQEEGEKLTT